MKKLFILLSCIFIFLQMSAQTSSRVSGIGKPKAGSLQSFTYDAAGGPLEGKDSLNCVVYHYDNYVWKIDDINLKKEGANSWKGEFQIPEDCGFFALSFKAGYIGNQVIDNNDANGGYVYQALNAMNEVAPDGFLAWGIFRNQPYFNITNYYQKYTIPNDASLIWLNKEVDTYESNMPLFMDYYLKAVKIMAGTHYDKVVDLAFRNANKEFKMNEFLYSTFESAYRFDVKNIAKADSIHKVILEKFPHGFTSRADLFHKLENGEEDETTFKGIENFYKEYPYSECIKDQYAKNQTWMYYNLSRKYTNALFAKKQYDRIIKFLPNFNFIALSEAFRWNIFRPYKLHLASNDSIYPLAKALMGEMEQKRYDLSNMQDLEHSPKEAQTLLDYQFYERLGVYIQLLNTLNKQKEALQWFKYYDNPQEEYIAFGDATINQVRYDIYMNQGQKDNALTVLKKSVKYDAITGSMLNALKEDIHPASDEAFDKYLNSLKSANIKDELQNTVKSNLVQIPFKPFKFLDPNGKPVSSASFKNKIVVIDFWANWCSPCKMAMEGMKLVVDKYAKDPNVLFYFVNTMDHGIKGKAAVDKFMASKSYTNFKVLYDTWNQSTGQFDASFHQFAQIFHSSGIPRKMILKDGLIQYTAGGYSGNPSQLADEMTSAIELIKKSGK
ncbi:TlpA family protein disulfide reductase [Prevotella cerevisiae]|uniref:TlpA family protein disulfide reductase n=1 Tax=Segatella cerevisiae TaxID=2053716 RepID=A0ABT1BXJ1_9BACT|nr:TlpA disulfide reductase family protein [Segatella cerevisiae]MCO6025797.1 TlpA family protein disulfide reductase [Segatella cerevisiae]